MKMVKCIHCGCDTPDSIGVCVRCGRPWDKTWQEVYKEELKKEEQEGQNTNEQGEQK